MVKKNNFIDRIFVSIKIDYKIRNNVNRNYCKTASSGPL